MLVELLYVQPDRLKAPMDEYDMTERDEQQLLRGQDLYSTLDRLGDVAHLLVEERKRRVAADGAATDEDEDMA